MTELQEYIGNYFGITREDMNQVSALFIEEHLPKGDFYIQSGQHCDKLSFVKEGFIRVFAHTEQKEVTQWISTKGYFITDLNSFIFQQKARWEMQAISDCTLYTIHKENYKLLNNLVPNWAEMEKRFIAACFVTLEDRVFKHLSLNAEDRYQQLFEKNKELFNQVPLQYLASMLGMSPETFSRIRSKKSS